ncbi:1-phosphofructokinase [Schnuerera sp. xch1]|uniref:1-phosphofructokinase n=1 Tax=Schnuerera sp. xch1 TaxID=2874283 RepID=UPI001CC00559|nr:1-phosphofructokinase [Schnuerera sp. xch1]MBZ2175511.1 1-phosphofructokinase [Schnuerera sp. xch1]
MILTVTLNPSIDRRYNINEFQKGKIFRTNDFQYTPGGKGLNVSKVVKVFGEPVVATGFLGGMSGNYIEEKLDTMNIGHSFVSIDGETRSCMAILSDDGSQTEILESGPTIAQKDIGRFYDLYKKLIKDFNIICASGSVPNGVNVDVYKDLISIANREGKKFILDTTGQALRKGLGASPYLIKPNKEELENLIGDTVFSEDDIIRGVKFVLEKGVKIVAVSLGSEGSLIFNDNYMYRIKVPTVKAVNPVGSGDSMIAGFAVSLNRNYDFESMLKLASACGTANAMEKETGKVDIDNINKLMKETFIEKIRL